MAKESEEESNLTSGRQRGTDDAFTGRSAQLTAIVELLRRRCNAAIPEVDLGTDLFAFRDDRGEMARVQVKACATPRTYADGSGYSARFSLPLKQLKQGERVPELFYVLAVLRADQWCDFLIVSQSRLKAILGDGQPFGFANPKNDELQLTIEFRDDVRCSGKDLTDYRNAWESLPPFRSVEVHSI